MEKGTLDPGVQLEGYGTLPDEEVELCCCEYVDECGAKRHLLQTFCDCAEFDEFVNRSVIVGDFLSRWLCNSSFVSLRNIT